MMPLSLADPGQSYRVRKIGGNDKTRLHLAEMGLVVDTPLTVVAQDAGNVILRVKDSRIALNRDLALRVQVTPPAN
ncbi:MAG: ferrous iron transport protein A [Kiritimatiellae bacterium]|nr:ferrous iron transport protein A [Kiritimatiellia bacterium]